MRPNMHFRTSLQTFTILLLAVLVSCPLYAAKKKTQAAPGTGRFEAEQNGLTLWDISQMFGVQLKKIRLYNSYRGDGPTHIGETIILRKL